MQALAAEELVFATHALAAALARVPERDQDESKSDELNLILAELRGLSALTANNELDGIAEPTLNLNLPPIDHPWNDPGSAHVWWHRILLRHSQDDLVNTWAHQVTHDLQSADQAYGNPGLRALLQKIAWETHSPSMFAVLKSLYEDQTPGAQRIASDQEYADVADLVEFGGPWTALLGLQLPQRTDRFPLPEPSEPIAATTPRITVLIPSYKHRQYIADTIRSVLAQSNTPFKLLVVDDCSPDDTAEIARSIDDPRLEVRVNATNLGLGNSVLSALAGIDTPFVALLNSDDLFHPDRLARCIEVLDSSPHVSIVTTGLTLIDAQSRHLTPETVSRTHDGLQVFNWVNWYASASVTDPNEGLFEQLLERNFLATSSNLTARTDWLRNRGTAFTNLKYCLDWQIFLDAALEGSLHYIPDPLVGYRLHPTNTVWFDEDSRWAFYLEVNRVLSNAIHSFARDRGILTEESTHRALRAVAGHVAANREADGMGLFLNAVLDDLVLDQLAAKSTRIQNLLNQLRKDAAERLNTKDKQALTATPHRKIASRLLLANLHRERLLHDQSALRHRHATLTGRIKELRAEVQIAVDRYATAAERIHQLKDVRTQDLEQAERLRSELALERSTQQTLRDELKI